MQTIEDRDESPMHRYRSSRKINREKAEDGMARAVKCEGSQNPKVTWLGSVTFGGPFQYTDDTTVISLGNSSSAA